MALTIERNRPFLELLSTTKDKKQKQALLEIATPGQLRALCECVLNICKGRIHFTPQQQKKILAHSQTLREIATCQIPLAEKRNNILQDLLNNKTDEESENEESDSNSDSEDIEDNSKDIEESSEDSGSEIEDERKTNQTGGGLFPILLPLLTSTILPALLKK